MKLELKSVPVKNLKPFEGNPRTISEEGLDRIKSSIKGFGFVEPAIAWKDGKGQLMLIVGHQRLKAAIKNGEKEIPVIVYPFKSKKEAMAYNIASNKTGEFAEWDFPKLQEGLEFLDDGEFDLELTGFNESEIEDIQTWSNQSENNNNNEKVKKKIKCPQCGYEW